MFPSSGYWSRGQVTLPEVTFWHVGAENGSLQALRLQSFGEVASELRMK
jgi:hypothetical protein